jgi:hypothetical protein
MLGMKVLASRAELDSDDIETLAGILDLRTAEEVLRARHHGPWHASAMYREGLSRRTQGTAAKVGVCADAG